ncbi:hypothetical protein DL93DRAFT_2102658 [Clavulina sp. PMI_390]|nr:hypothetical protein DL93DRAFT_2102658 [Clavulina sp. PMI_390]
MNQVPEHTLQIGCTRRRQAKVGRRYKHTNSKPPCRTRARHTSIIRIRRERGRACAQRAELASFWILSKLLFFLIFLDNSRMGGQECFNLNDDEGDWVLWWKRAAAAAARNEANVGAALVEIVIDRLGRRDPYKFIITVVADIAATVTDTLMR